MAGLSLSVVACGDGEGSNGGKAGGNTGGGTDTGGRTDTGEGTDTGGGSDTGGTDTGGGSDTGGGTDTGEGTDTGGGSDTGGGTDTGSGSDTGSGTDTGGEDPLDGEQLGELTAAEAQQVCDDVTGSLDLSKEDLCDLAGVLASVVDGTDCETARADCIRAPEAPEPAGSCDTAGFAGCTATVAELKACMIATGDAFEAITCASSIDDFSPQPAACAAVNVKCPGLLAGA
ncbi:hypothetical protein [Sorangium sp. So ce381]|uniref:hypothetical protein n=1 Tax=Sorangium sp. So ce381 TaxID=3133307 RepID=UPI003F5C0279